MDFFVFLFFFFIRHDTQKTIPITVRVEGEEKNMEVLQNWARHKCYALWRKINFNENFNFVALPPYS